MSDGDNNDQYDQQDELEQEPQQDEDQQDQQDQQDQYENENENIEDAPEPEPEYKQPEPEPEPEPEPQYVPLVDNGKPLSPNECWKGVSRDDNAFNWYLLTVDKSQKLEYVSRGNGGLKELQVYLKNKDTEVYFGLLRVNSVDKNKSKRAKFVHIRFIGTKVPVMKKAKLTPSLGKIGQEFPVKHLTFDLNEELVHFDANNLLKEFLRVGGGEKTEKYEFGPGQNMEM